MHHQRLGAVALTLAIGLAVTGCDNGGPAAPTISVHPDSAIVHGVAADLSGTMPKLRIATSAATREVIVTYWSDTTGGLRVHATIDSPTDTTVVALPRTVLGRRYDYVVQATGLEATVSTRVTGTIDAPAPDAGLAALKFTASGHATNPLTLLELHGAAYDGFVIVDSAGAPVWQWRTVGAPSGSTRRANGDFALIDAGAGLLEVTPTGDVVRRLVAHDPNQDHDVAPHHDVIATPRNTLLFLSHDARTFQGHPLVGDAIWEWTPETGALTRRWSTFDALDPATDVGGASVNDDWVHANALALGPRGNVVLSMRFLDQVLSIGSDWKHIEWRLGGPHATLQLTSGAPFYGQHSAQELPDGRVLLFDNGWDGTRGPGVSRLLALTIDTTARTASVAWEWRPNATAFSPIVGTARALGGGHTFGLFGVSAGFLGATGPVRAVEVDAAGRLLWSLTVDGVQYAYRATPIDGLLGEEPVSASAIRALLDASAGG